MGLPAPLCIAPETTGKSFVFCYRHLFPVKLQCFLSELFQVWKKFGQVIPGQKNPSFFYLNMYFVRFMILLCIGRYGCAAIYSYHYIKALPAPSSLPATSHPHSYPVDFCA